MGASGGYRAPEKGHSAQETWYYPGESGTHLLSDLSLDTSETSYTSPKHLTEFWFCYWRAKGRSQPNTAHAHYLIWSSPQTWKASFTPFNRWQDCYSNGSVVSARLSLLAPSLKHEFYETFYILTKNFWCLHCIHELTEQFDCLVCIVFMMKVIYVF